MQDVYKCLETDRAFVAKEFPDYDVLGVFVYGSQNYNLATEDSDVDTVAVLVPSLRKLMLDEKVSKTFEFPDHHVVVKDLPSFNKHLLTLSPMAVEPLFARYKWVNPVYARLWFDEYEDYRETIAFACPEVTYDKVRAMVKSLCKKKDMTYKQFVLCQRLVDFLWKLCRGESYANALWVDDAYTDWFKACKQRTDLVPDSLKESMLDRVCPTLLVQYFAKNNCDDRDVMREHLAATASLMVLRKENKF